MNARQIDAIFTYHAPFGTQPQRYEQLRSTARQLAHEINNACPESREKSLAITHLQQSIMFANAAIAVNEEDHTKGIVETPRTGEDLRG